MKSPFFCLMHLIVCKYCFEPGKEGCEDDQNVRCLRAKKGRKICL